MFFSQVFIVVRSRAKRCKVNVFDLTTQIRYDHPTVIFKITVQSQGHPVSATSQ